MAGEDHSPEALQKSVASHHEQLQKLNAEITRLQQQRVAIKLSAAATLTQVAALSRAADLIPRIIVRCW